MKKDVIYIDTEDDITTIIDKVKNAGAPIVALVPPKRVGVLQSIVNLKLLQRAASSVDKRLVLITNDTALTALASGLSMPIAKNLQSKPEIAPIAALDSDDSDVIDGEELPAPPKTADTEAEKSSNNDEIDTATLAAAGKAADSVGKANPGAKKKKKGIFIPNFDSFRKKLFLFGGLGLLLIVFLIWAVFFASRATVAITAKTNVINISKSLQLVPDATLDAAQGTLPAVVKQIKKTASVDFTPTGKKEVGEKATGTVRFTNGSSSSISVPAGTQLTSSSGIGFVVDSAVTVPAATLSFSCPGYLCPGTVNATVTAANPGSNANGASGSLSGAPGGASVAFTTPSGGGTDKTVPVVTEEDVAKANEQLKSQDSAAVKNELKKQFDSDTVVIDEAFVIDTGAPTSSPAVGAEATSAAKLTSETTYTLVGAKRADLKAVYKAYLDSQMGDDKNQKVYENGENATQFSQFVKTDRGYSVRATAVAQIGPNIDEKKLAEDIKGKRSGEVQQHIEAIQGVENVKVNFWPFWVSSVPNDTSRVTITFSLSNNDGN